MEKHISGIKIVNSFLWKFFERSGLQIVNLIVQIILARLLTPSDFAVVAIITVFITIANIFIQTGFGTALVQCKDTCEDDYSTIFFIGLISSILIIIILSTVAPIIAGFYKMEELTMLIRAQSVIVLIGAFNTVQQAIMSRNMQFKKNFFARIIACIFSGALAVTTAYNDFGIWSIIVLNISNNLIYTIILWVEIRWKPHVKFSRNAFNKLFAFSWKLIVANLIGTIYDNLRPLVMGKFYEKVLLGYYNRADVIASSLMNGITASISAVMLPVLSKYQDDRWKIKDKLKKTFAINCFICVPMMLGIAAVSNNLIVVLFTERWIKSGVFLSILCIGYSFYPIHSANLQAIYAIGKSGVVLKLEIIKKVIGIVLIFVSIPFGVYAVTASVVVMSILSTLINSRPNKLYIGYPMKEQIRDIGIYYIMSIVMAVIVYGIGFILTFKSALFNLFLQIIVGAFVYFVQCVIIKPYAYKYSIELIKRTLMKV